jgi:cytochrome c oxidase subunit II
MRLLWVKSSRLVAVLITSLMVFVITGCGSDRIPKDILTPFSQVASETADLFYIVFWIAVVIFILVEGLLVFFVFRYHRRSQDEHPEQYHGNTRLEVTWTLIPALILAVVFALTIRTMGTTGPTTAPGQGIPIKVVGHQWWWEIQYDNGNVLTASELHMPTGQVMNLALDSVDVIHSFWVPSLMGKTDTVPTHDNKTWILANIPGVYDGQCAEFCGTQHANMMFRVIVQNPPDYQQWFQGQQAPAAEPPAGSLAAQGKAIITDPQNRCITCHAIKGTTAVGITGPNLTHFATRGCFAGCKFDMNHDNLTKWLTNPEAMKPGNLMAQVLRAQNVQLTPDQVAALTAYLESLR